jgi:hypothetical protein
VVNAAAPSGALPPDPVLKAVWADAEAAGFAGWDPYDGLNSPVLRITPLYRIGPARQAWIQLVKRSPLNLRPLLGQKREVVAKGLALFAVGAWRLTELGGSEAGLWRARGTALLDRLIALRSPGFDEIAWGYPFDWQSRAFFQRRDEPNLICSVFGSAAFEERADGGDRTGVPAEVARFIVRRLRREEGGVAWITYTPATNTRIHNVNMLGAAHLAVEAARTGAAEYADLARRAMEFSVGRIRADGSWPYGEASNQGWVDNYHMGYNLVALERYRQATGETWMDEAFERAWRYWDLRFVDPDGAPRHFDTSRWPLDIHCPAQAIVTRLALKRLDPDAVAKARAMAAWTHANMSDGHGRFTFQKTRFYANHVPMMRWGQAWMFRALAELSARG